MRILLALPPLTQLNTPYPSTAYLTGFLRGRGHEVTQVDLGLELVLRLLSPEGLTEVFDAATDCLERGELPAGSGVDFDDAAETLQWFVGRRERYEKTVAAAVRFLQGNDPTLATRIAGRRLLPEGPRFADADDVDWAFGELGVRDRARFVATRFIDDLADLIRVAVDPHFAFTRYAESLASAAVSYDPIATALAGPPTLVVRHLLAAFDEAVVASGGPELVGFSVPFPGNLLGALLCGQRLAEIAPNAVRVLGGGYPNTELRSLSEPRIFDAVDYVTLDDGERPLLAIIELLECLRPESALRRTFARRDGAVVLLDGATEPDVPQADLPAPDYEGLRLDGYLSVLSVPNPMHRLWSDGRWNKLTVAHGCYWKKCSFCDVGLDYIGRYDPAPTQALADRIETLVAQTGDSGFHFVDEAAPPAALRDLALELLARGTAVSWWTNIRFEKAFTPDLCRLLVASGCIAVSGGLEVASDRLLEKMRKGVTVEQVARVAADFTDAGALVHAYLMYGFPTQTEQETVDALEVVRQLFDCGAVRSGYWHRFAMTVHSPVGKDPAAFGVVAAPIPDDAFARNEQGFEDPGGVDHEGLGRGLALALHNFMLGAGLDTPVDEWFEGQAPPSTEPIDRISQALEAPRLIDASRTGARLVWLGEPPDLLSDPGTGELAGVMLYDADEPVALECPPDVAEWLCAALDAARPVSRQIVRLRDVLADCPVDGTALLDSELWSETRRIGLVLV